MPNSDEMRIIQRMEDQQHIAQIHEQRITQVETRMMSIEVKLPYLDSAINKLTIIADAQTKQGALTEQAVVALKEGQEQHSKHIEDLTKGQVEIGHAAATLKARFDSLWRILGTIGTALLLAGAGYVFSIFAQHHP